MRRTLLGVALLAVMVTSGAWLMHAGVEIERPAAGGSEVTESRSALGHVKRWGYQLKNLDPRAAGASAFDLLVVDPDNLKGWRSKTQEAAVDIMRQKPDGSRRLVLAYLSIGEAESYRDYWSKSWVEPVLVGGNSVAAARPAASSGGRFAAPPIGGATAVARQPSRTAPAWLAEENPRWRGNYLVRYWDAGWQALMFGGPQAALDQIVAAGFDGVYLDRADVHAAFRPERPTAETEMVDLILRLAAYAREQNPEFLVVMQNAEELIAHGRVRQTIDAVAKEDLLYGVAGPAAVNDPADVTASLHYLSKLRREGRPVFVVEYVDSPKLVAEARDRLSSLDFVPYFAPRDLDRLQVAQ